MSPRPGWVMAAWLMLVPAYAAAEDVGPSATGECLVRAARAQDVTAVERILASGLDANTPGRVAPNAYGATRPLIAAVGSVPRGPARLTIMTRLLAAGADVDGGGPGDGTALIVAATLLDVEGVAFLLEHGARPDLADQHGITPLLALFRTLGEERKHLDILRRLLERGADPNALDAKRRFTALAEAVKRRSAPMVNLLLEHGADPNVVDAAGTTALLAAASRAHLGEDSADIVLRLVQTGADINARDPRGQTAATMAAADGHHAMVLLLGALGAADAQPRLAGMRVDGPRQLMQAMTRRDRAEVRLLLAAGVDVNVPDARGWTPLMHAADRGDDSIVAMLLAGGAQVGTTTAGVTTPLHIAIMRHDIGSVRQLLAGGADVHAPNSAGETPIIMAAKYNATRSVDSSSAVPPPAAGSRPSQGSPARYVVASERLNGDPNATMGQATSPRSDMGREDAEMVAVLLDAAADPNSRDPAGRTPLMFAAAQERVEMVRVLLAHGADAEARAANGRTALQVATGQEVKSLLRQAMPRK